jgi:hypothetical protein
MWIWLIAPFGLILRRGRPSVVKDSADHGNDLRVQRRRPPTLRWYHIDCV